jgi:hypothetical protein
MEPARMRSISTRFVILPSALNRFRTCCSLPSSGARRGREDLDRGNCLPVGEVRTSRYRSRTSSSTGSSATTGSERGPEGGAAAAGDGFMDSLAPAPLSPRPASPRPVRPGLESRDRFVPRSRRGNGGRSRGVRKRCTLAMRLVSTCSHVPRRSSHGSIPGGVGIARAFPRTPRPSIED